VAETTGHRTGNSAGSHWESWDSVSQLSQGDTTLFRVLTLCFASGFPFSQDFEDSLRDRHCGLSPTVNSKIEEKQAAMKVKVKEMVRRYRSFDLNVGGFTVKNCRWYVASRRILFPVRYDQRGRRFRVVFAYGQQVRRLRDLLESGDNQTPRDRRPCNLKIRFLGRWNEWIIHNREWMIFNFTVRGFTILGCRWHPSSGSIQLPVTFLPFDEQRLRRPKKRVVCAYGAHIVRLRKALEARWLEVTGEPVPERAESAVPA
jgi:hypothetical protein